MVMYHNLHVSINDATMLKLIQEIPRNVYILPHHQFCATEWPLQFGLFQGKRIYIHNDNDGCYLAKVFFFKGVLALIISME